MRCEILIEPGVTADFDTLWDGKWCRATFDGTQHYADHLFPSDWTKVLSMHGLQVFANALPLESAEQLPPEKLSEIRDTAIVRENIWLAWDLPAHPGAWTCVEVGDVWGSTGPLTSEGRQVLLERYDLISKAWMLPLENMQTMSPPELLAFGSTITH